MTGTHNARDFTRVATRARGTRAETIATAFPAKLREEPAPMTALLNQHAAILPHFATFKERYSLLRVEMVGTLSPRNEIAQTK